MDFAKTVTAMLQHFGDDPAQHMHNLLVALGGGIAAATVCAETPEQQTAMLDALFDDIRTDAAARYAAYDAFLALERAAKKGLH